MKHITHPTKALTLVALAILSLQGLPAQTPLPSPSPGVATGNAPTTPQCKERRKALLKNLSPAEKVQLEAALKQIHQDPELVTARQTLKEAQTPEARMAARKSLEQIRRTLLLKVDPAIQPILDKIKEAHTHHPSAQ
jgi:hypothetical protein